MMFFFCCVYSKLDDCRWEINHQKNRPSLNIRFSIQLVHLHWMFLHRSVRQPVTFEMILCRSFVWYVLPSMVTQQSEASQGPVLSMYATILLDHRYDLFKKNFANLLLSSSTAKKCSFVHARWTSSVYIYEMRNRWEKERKKERNPCFTEHDQRRYEHDVRWSVSPRTTTSKCDMKKAKLIEREGQTERDRENGWFLRVIIAEAYLIQTNIYVRTHLLLQWEKKENIKFLVEVCRYDVHRDLIGRLPMTDRSRTFNISFCLPSISFSHLLCSLSSFCVPLLFEVSEAIIIVNE